MDDVLLYELINKYLSGIASEDEIKQLECWYNNNLSGDIIIPFYSESEKDKLLTDLRAKIKAHVDQDVQKRKSVFYYVGYAASIIILLGMGYVLRQHFSTSRHINNDTQTTKAKDVPPGRNGAILTLSDGSKYVLDSAGNGVLTTQAGASIVKQGDQIIYNKVVDKPTAVVYNTLIVPKGRQFKIVLPDGTGVWLNSASSLKYPTSFTEKERIVELQGEAYFEVIHNAQQPFKVKVGNTVAEDLGTAFNVDGYDDEPSVKTTLIRGSVKVTGIKDSKILSPGEQAVSTANKLIVAAIDTSQVLAWKDGFFQFDEADLTTVMRQLARWYNIEVVFAGNVPSRKFYGRINRNMNLSNVLNLLEKNQVHFNLEGGNKLIVKP